jgi:transcriptional regulator with XRE-family HTH domain
MRGKTKGGHMSRSPTETDIVVGTRIRIRRKQLGMTQTSLADRLGITFQQVQKYEKGANRVGASRLADVAQVLEIPISFFFPQPDSIDSPDEVLSLLSDPQALELQRAFALVTSATMRKAIVGLARAAGEVPRPELQPGTPKHV